jgi:hypothetical protein
MRTLRTQRSLLLALAVCACEGEPAERDATPAPARSATPGPAVEAAPAAAAGDLAARAPDTVLVRRGVCPFECCVYGEWALGTAAPVREAPSVNAPTLFTLAANQRFRADSGFVHITGRQLVVVHDTIDQRPSGPRFVPGDTLLLLDYIGEGHYHVWTGASVVEVEGFWGAEATRPSTELIGSYARDWWIHATLDEKQGWLLVEPTLQLIGADACGSPPPWRSG